jgi:hypothetical protein
MCGKMIIRVRKKDKISPTQIFHGKNNLTNCIMVEKPCPLFFCKLSW